MGRPRMFDEATVLDAVAAEFRVHGFAGTSTKQLCEAAGMLQGSLYNAFTSKDELHVRALEHYTRKYRELQATILTDTDRSGAERLLAVMDAVLQEERDASEHGHGAGCMVVHAMMTPGLRERDERISLILNQDLRQRQSLLEGAIRVGHLDGSISRGIDPDVGALTFIAVTNGIRTMGQAGVPPEDLRRIALAGIAPLLS